MGSSAGQVGDNRQVKRFSPFVVYTSARLALFIVTATILALLGMQGIGLLMVALVVSGLLSYVLLSRLRDAVSEAVVTRGSRSRTGPRRPLSGLRRRMEAATTAEDAEDDARRAAEEAAAGQPSAEQDPPER